MHSSYLHRTEILTSNSRGMVTTREFLSMSFFSPPQVPLSSNGADEKTGAKTEACTLCAATHVKIGESQICTHAYKPLQHLSFQSFLCTQIRLLLLSGELNKTRNIKHIVRSSGNGTYFYYCCCRDRIQVLNCSVPHQLKRKTPKDKEDCKLTL